MKFKLLKMMKKLISNLFITSGIALFSGVAHAEQLSQSEALMIASEFLSKVNTTTITPQSNSRLTLAHTQQNQYQNLIKIAFSFSIKAFKTGL